MIRKINLENMQVTFRFGPNFLCDGHVIEVLNFKRILLDINAFLCDGHVIEAKLLSCLINFKP